MKRSLMILMFVCLALLLVLAPSFASGQKDGAAKSGKVWKVGVSTQAWKYEFIKNLVNALQAADKNIPELELTIIDSEDSVEKQLNDIDSLIAKKVDGIIMDGNSFEGCSPAVVACKKANIPMVQVVTYTQNEDYHTFVGTDVKSSGFMAADAIAKAVGEKGNVFMIEGMMGASGQINRSAGISEGLAKYPGIKLVEKQTGEWSKDKSIALAENWLTKYPKIDGIVAQNDGMALGAMNACIAAGRTSIKLVGIDGDSEALQAVIDGTFSATILDDVWTEARLAVEAMRDILAGKDVPKKIIVDYVPVTTKEKAKEFLSQRGK